MEGNHIPDVCEWIMHTARIPYAEYRKLVNLFDPIHFNADRWMQDINRYGCKYVCFTAKHHDGFAMYDSKVSEYNVMHTHLDGIYSGR